MENNQELQIRKLIRETLEEAVVTKNQEVASYLYGLLGDKAERVKNLVKYLKLDLYEGPTYASEMAEADDEEYPGFKAGTAELSTLLDELPGEVYYDNFSGEIMTSEPDQDEDSYFELETMDPKKVIAGNELYQYV